MKEIIIDKITLNIGTSGGVEKIERGIKLLSKITNEKPVQTTTKKRIPTWGLRPGLPIGCKVTLRGKKAEEILKKLLESMDNKLPLRKFDDFGNLSFGVKEYINIPGVEYDADIGIIGLEVAVTLKRYGFRVKLRKLKKGEIGKSHIISRDDAIKFMEKKFGVNIAK